MKLLLALGVAKYIKSYKIHFVQYATDYCPLEHDNYKTISAHLGSPISCYINNLHGAFIFLLSVDKYLSGSDLVAFEYSSNARADVLQSREV